MLVASSWPPATWRGDRARRSPAGRRRRRVPVPSRVAESVTELSRVTRVRQGRQSSSRGRLLAGPASGSYQPSCASDVEAAVLVTASDSSRWQRRWRAFSFEGKSLF